MLVLASKTRPEMRAVAARSAARAGAPLLCVGDAGAGHGQAQTDNCTDNPVVHEPIFVSPGVSIARLARGFNAARRTEAHAVPPAGR